MLADDSHIISFFFSKIRKDVAIFVAAAVVIGTLRVYLLLPYLVFTCTLVLKALCNLYLFTLASLS